MAGVLACRGVSSTLALSQAGCRARHEQRSAAAGRAEAAAARASPRSFSFTGLRRDAPDGARLALLERPAGQACVSGRARRVRAPGAMASARSRTPPKKILMMGGSRFIGVYLARLLVQAGHDVTLFTRGKTPVTQKIPGETDSAYRAYSSKVKHIKGDRGDAEGVKSLLKGKGFQVVYDINGREATDAEPILAALPNLQQYIFCSSAGVYLKTDQLPHREEDDVDPKSRHKGKLDTEELLRASGVPWTSIRPVYIYGPLNYNPVEEWFFQRLAAGRPIPIPTPGLQVTQLGHVKDLARAFVLVLGNENAIGQVYNISGPKYVTFDGIAKACAAAMGQGPPQIVHYRPKDFDFGKKKDFPMRDQHFFASNDKAIRELGWTPEYGLVDGLKDSYDLDFGRGTFRKEADFETDDMILDRLGSKVPVSARGR